MFNPAYNSLAANAFQTFVSRPDLRPPLLNVQGDGTPGLVLFNVMGRNVSQPSLVIADNTGEIVYVNPDFSAGTNFKLQTDASGEQFLTFWNGTFIPTHGQSGNYYLMDNHLNVVRTLERGVFADSHEFHFVPHTDTALTTFYYPQAMNLTKFGGPADGFVYGSGFQQIDLHTGETLFEWRSTDHVSPAETSPNVTLAVAGPELKAVNGDGTAVGGNGTGPWDYFHINSVDTHPTDGSFLISARHTSSIYKISSKPEDHGKVQWTLTGYDGLGKPGGFGDFALGPGVKFTFQHHARWRSLTEISLYDDASLGHFANSEPTSRALRLRLSLPDTSASKNGTGLSASLIQELINPAHPLTGSQGNFQILDNGNYWVGYGSEPLLAEFSHTGKLISQYQLGPPGSDVEAYRTFKVNFTITPSTQPDLAVQNRSVFMSWNGATEVKEWAVYTAHQLVEKDFKLVGKAKKTGFETKFTVPAGKATEYTIVDALDNKGKVIGTSKVVHTA